MVKYVKSNGGVLKYLSKLKVVLHVHLLHLKHDHSPPGVLHSPPGVLQMVKLIHLLNLEVNLNLVGFADLLVVNLHLVFLEMNLKLNLKLNLQLNLKLNL